MQVFRIRTPTEAINLVSQLLEYTPSARITPLKACAHPFFDELRQEGNTTLPNGRPMPPLFNFTEHGKCARKAYTQTKKKLIFQINNFEVFDIYVFK